MSAEKNDRLSFDDFDEANYPRRETTDFERITDRVLSRRRFLGGSAKLGAAAFLLGTTSLLNREGHAASSLDFPPVAANSLDTITVPDGFDWHVVTLWGDPLWSHSKPFDPVTRGTAASQLLAVGDNTDGMSLFEIDGRTVLVANNEYVNLDIIYGNRASKGPETADDVRKAMAAHGITISEIRKDGGKWRIVRDSPYNRRLTASSPMEITGPARGHALMKTEADSAGTRALGTLNNCGNGRTPWGTYLTCEENFNGYFSSSDEAYAPSPSMTRYGVGNKDWGYGWARVEPRFDISKHPNEPNRFGYIVEIDPEDPTSTPKKRTALGRFKHENAELVVAKNGEVVVYLGDDERGEFLYRFVSAGKYVEGGNNRDLLEEGTLFVAKFSDDSSGRWIPLTPATTGMSEAEIAIRTREAASAVGATTMDRPEWVAVNPHRAEAYLTLTNNKDRGIDKTNAGGDPMPLNGPNPRAENNYGHIVRWRPAGEDHAAETFTWDIYVLAGNPALHEGANAGSVNITADNMFNSPDGLAFDASGNLWIQTDGNYSDSGDFKGMGNNQMLLGDPATGEIKRFLVGPKESEVTGITWSPDRRTLFVGIQHPGEKGNSHFPDGGTSVPRSAVIAINRKDGGLIG